MFTTYPRSLLDSLLWPILRVAWEKPLGSRKTAHFWHWRTVSPKSMPTKTVTPAPDEKARPTTNYFWNFFNVNFGWQEVVIFEVVEKEYPFQIGIRGIQVSGLYRKLRHILRKRPEAEMALRCSIILPAGSQVGLLLGPSPIQFSAQTPNGCRTLTLREVGRATRSTLDPNIPLL
jgi:hypothetical protein